MMEAERWSGGGLGVREAAVAARWWVAQAEEREECGEVRSVLDRVSIGGIEIEEGGSVEADWRRERSPGTRSRWMPEMIGDEVEGHRRSGSRPAGDG
jgi:hypothetical protein